MECLPCLSSVYRQGHIIYINCVYHVYHVYLNNSKMCIEKERNMDREYNAKVDGHDGHDRRITKTTYIYSV